MPDLRFSISIKQDGETLNNFPVLRHATPTEVETVALTPTTTDTITFQDSAGVDPLTVAIQVSDTASLNISNAAFPIYAGGIILFGGTTSSPTAVITPTVGSTIQGIG